MIRAPAAVTAAFAVGLAGCGTTPTLRPADIQTTIADGLRTQVGGEFAVTCPSDIPAERGGGFDCRVVDGQDGATITVRVTQEDDRGAFTWRVIP